jgi:hypothetical protein
MASRPLQAMIFGMRAVGRAPTVVLGTYLLLVAMVLPAAGALTWILQSALEGRALDLEAGPVVEEDWFDRANDASRVVVGDSFSPAIIGFAAPLSNLADLATARDRSLPTSGSLIAWLAAWTFVLGGVLQRFANGLTIGPGEFLHACVRRVPSFAAVALMCLAAYAGAVAVSAALPRQVVLVVVTMAVGVVSVAAGYARARMVTEDVRLWPALAATARMMRSAPLTCAAHASLALVAWLGLLAAFAAADLLFGRGGQPWRAIVLMQGFIVARLALRLVWEASTLHLVRVLK